MANEIDFSDAGTYESNIKSLRAVLSKDGKTVTGSKEHEEALIVTLIQGATKLDVLIRKSDLYLMGFKTSAGSTWFVFSTYGDFAKKNAGSFAEQINKVKNTAKKEYRMANSFDTGVGCNYNDLGIFGSYVYVGASSIGDALATLAKYAGRGSKLDTTAAAIVIFVVSEALRFTSICTAVAKAIKGEDFAIDDFKDTVTNWDAAPSSNLDVVIRKS